MAVAYPITDRYITIDTPLAPEDIERIKEQWRVAHTYTGDCCRVVTLCGGDVTVREFVKCRYCGQSIERGDSCLCPHCGAPA